MVEQGCERRSPFQFAVPEVAGCPRPAPHRPASGEARSDVESEVASTVQLQVSPACGILVYLSRIMECRTPSAIAELSDAHGIVQFASG